MVSVTVTTTVCHATQLLTNDRPLALVLLVERHQLLVVLLRPLPDIVLRMKHSPDMQVNVKQWACLEAHGYSRSIISMRNMLALCGWPLNMTAQQASRCTL